MNDEYQAYMLRLKRSSDQVNWRVSLENAHTGEHLHFPNERALLRHLLKLFKDPPPPPSAHHS